ncbi:glycosyltransferase [Cellulosilyticum ruminicola]|uniref:glycosyltransferase n=1 Tax=Cellulosilyticum ruminicola TaxID=425254 RepID=UPI0006D17622|nr:glycosyltransferase [Cellulosilyticum ruminicola]
MQEIKISIITPTRKQDCIEHLIENYYRQEYKHKELIIVINNDNMQTAIFDKYIAKDSSIHVYRLPARLHLAQCLNLAVSKAKLDYIARFDDDDFYGEKYLQEINENFQTKHCDIINKGSFYTYFKEIKILMKRGSGKENRYGAEGGGATTCFKKEIFNNINYVSIDRCDSVLMKACRAARYKIYSTSSHNFMAVRSTDISVHTYQKPFEFFLKNPRNKIVAEQIEYEEACRLINTL